MSPRVYHTDDNMWSVKQRPQNFTCRMPLGLTTLTGVHPKFWPFTESFRELNDKAIQWYLTARYPAFGETFLKFVYMGKPYTHVEWEQFMTACDQETVPQLKFYDERITKILATLRGKHVTLGLSGGIDSTFLLAKCLQLDIDVEALCVYSPHYDETDAAFETAEYLGARYKQYLMTDSDVLSEIVNIVKELGIPHDRGATVPTYFLTKHAREVLVVGDYADTIFGPSMNSEIKCLTKGTRYIDTIPRIPYYKMKRIFKNPQAPNIKDFPHWFGRAGRVETMMLWDICSTNTFGNRHRYTSFVGKDQDVVMPYCDVRMLEASLSDKALHIFTGRPTKKALRRICRNYVPKQYAKKLLNRHKKAFKIDTRHYGFIVEKHLDPDVLHEMEIFKDINFYKLPMNIQYLLSLLCIWWRLKNEHTQK